MATAKQVYEPNDSPHSLQARMKWSNQLNCSFLTGFNVFGDGPQSKLLGPPMPWNQKLATLDTSASQDSHGVTAGAADRRKGTDLF